MDNDKSELRWGVAQLLEFIEFRLFWEGHVNRSDLMEQFGLSVNQASADLNRYIGFVPDNMVYDKSARTYVRGTEYAPHFLKPDASRHLAQIRRRLPSPAGPRTGRRSSGGSSNRSTRTAGEWDSPKTDWRIAIRHALIRDDEDVPKTTRRPRPKLPTEKTPDLFSDT